MNIWMGIGNLTSDPALRYTASGHAVANFTIACETRRDTPTQFIDIACWRKLATVVTEHLRKGASVAVTGKLTIRSYEDQNGVRRKTAEIVADQVKFLDKPTPKKDEENPFKDADIPF